MYRRRSREGAWIEMLLAFAAFMSASGRSREGAWIEIVLKLPKKSKSLSRSREGAWIEIFKICFDRQ